MAQIVFIGLFPNFWFGVVQRAIQSYSFPLGDSVFFRLWRGLPVRAARRRGGHAIVCREFIYP